MCAILLSIKPEFVKKIFAGSKKYEFRRRICKEKVERIVIYETNPTKKVVGEIEVSRVLQNSPEALWEETHEYAGIKQESFMQYFHDCNIAYGYEIKKIKVYKEPRELKDYGIVAPPQSFVYL